MHIEMGDNGRYSETDIGTVSSRIEPQAEKGKTG